MIAFLGFIGDVFGLGLLEELAIALRDFFKSLLG